MAYDFSGLSLSGVPVEHITSFTMDAKKGEHSVVHITGLLKPEDKDKVIHKVNEHQTVKVEIKGKKPFLLFGGLVSHIGIRAAAESYELELEVISGTCLMDKKKCSRSFQDTSMTYHQIIRKIMEAYPGSDCILEIPDKPIGSLVVQYEETDWEFIKRLVSVFGEGMFPAVDREGIRFYAGVPEIPAEKFTPIRTVMDKDMEAYYRRRAEKGGSNVGKIPMETDYLIFKMDSYDVAVLGNCITRKGQKFYVRKLKIAMENGLLTGHYEVQKKQGIRQRPIHPMQLVGVALEGEILAPKADKVKVHLAIDPVQDQAGACWIPYSTMSASNDGSGWYCMPEAGDTVRVYFPTKDTKDAVALSAVSNYDPSVSGSMETAAPASTGGSRAAAGSGGSSSGGGGGDGGGDRMGDPNVIFLSTVHGKEVKLAPDGIRISCGKTASVVEIGSSGEVSFTAEKKIEVLAEEKIEITTPGMLTMAAGEKIELSCDQGGKLILNENIILQGTEVKVD